MSHASGTLGATNHSNQPRKHIQPDSFHKSGNDNSDLSVQQGVNSKPSPQCEQRLSLIGSLAQGIQRELTWP